MTTKEEKRAAPGNVGQTVSMKCMVCGANCYTDGTADCDCDDHDYGRFITGAV